MNARIMQIVTISLLFLTACSTTFRVPKVTDMPDRSIGSVDYGPKEPVK